jgi:hypothetical protein
MFASWMRKTQGTALDRTQELEKNVALQLPHLRGGMVVRVERGLVLVTREGDLEDHLIGGGSELLLAPGGMTVAWALAPSRFLVREPGTVEVLQFDPGRHLPGSC